MITYPSTTDWRKEEFTEDEEAARELAEAFAWTSLRSLTGGRLAIAPMEVRPVRPACGGLYYVAPVGGVIGPFEPYVGVDGLWRNAVHSGACDCNDHRDVVLPGPVAQIDSVEVDGTILDPSVYRIDNGQILVRLDGQGWPARQDMYAIPGERNTFIVRYFQGAAPDAMDNYAAGVLAKEYLASMGVTPKGKCRLPKNVTAVTRQGVSYEVAASAFLNGITGIPEVDAVVARHNPFGLKVPTRIESVDSLRANRRTTLSRAGFAGNLNTPVTGSLAEDPANPGYFVTQGIDLTPYTTGSNRG